MSIALIVLLLVLGVTAVVGIVAYLVDRSTARLERKE
jgi:preprotein translocase subunit SecE